MFNLSNYCRKRVLDWLLPLSKLLGADDTKTQALLMRSGTEMPIWDNITPVDFELSGVINPFVNSLHTTNDTLTKIATFPVPQMSVWKFTIVYKAQNDDFSLYEGGTITFAVSRGSTDVSPGIQIGYPQPGIIPDGTLNILGDTNVRGQYIIQMTPTGDGEGVDVWLLPPPDKVININFWTYLY